MGYALLGIGFVSLLVVIVTAAESMRRAQSPLAPIPPKKG
ncbi:hypothetical protein shim_06040 [Shimia sp. SK013]|nr:hypothetical protein shim_06040 [Shimia sp. SK013]